MLVLIRATCGVTAPSWRSMCAHQTSLEKFPIQQTGSWDRVTSNRFFISAFEFVMVALFHSLETDLGPTCPRARLPTKLTFPVLTVWTWPTTFLDTFKNKSRYSFTKSENKTTASSFLSVMLILGGIWNFQNSFEPELWHYDSIFYWQTPWMSVWLL